MKRYLDEWVLKDLTTKMVLLTAPGGENDPCPSVDGVVRECPIPQLVSWQDLIALIEVQSSVSGRLRYGIEPGAGAACGDEAFALDHDRFSSTSVSMRVMPSCH